MSTGVYDTRIFPTEFATCFAAVFQDAGIDLDQPVTTMCYLGNAATVVALAGHLCGKHDVSVYYVSIVQVLPTT